jgi:hypothetical protein
MSKMTWKDFRGTLGFGPNTFGHELTKWAEEFERQGTADAKLWSKVAEAEVSNDGLKRSLCYIILALLANIVLLVLL